MLPLHSCSDLEVECHQRKGAELRVRHAPWQHPETFGIISVHISGLFTVPHADRPKTHRGQNPRGDPAAIRQLNATMWGWGRGGWMQGGVGVPPHLAAFIYISAAASNQANTGAQQGHTQMEIKQLVHFSFGRRGSNGPRVPAWFIICHFLSQHHCRELLCVWGGGGSTA